MVANESHADWESQPPYKPASQQPDFIAKHRGSCHCGRVKYSLSRDRPLSTKYCHCHDCRVLHGAPFQWAAIFHKSDMAFDKGTTGLAFYKSSTQMPEHDLPCKVSCSYCHTPIMDEGRNMVLLFPTLVHFKSAEERNLWKPQAHIFYSRRVVDISDDAVKWAGLDEKSEKL